MSVNSRDLALQKHVRSCGRADPFVTADISRQPPTPNARVFFQVIM